MDKVEIKRRVGRHLEGKQINDIWCVLIELKSSNQNEMRVDPVMHTTSTFITIFFFKQFIYEIRGEWDVI